MALSDELARKVGSRTKKGTKITQAHVEQARKIESDNLRIAQDNTRIIAEAINQAVMRGLEAVGLECQRIASDNAPVDTGRLAASITHALDPDEPAVYIGTALDYALPVHEGTSKTKPNRFLYNAANQNQTRFQAIFDAEMRNG